MSVEGGYFPSAPKLAPAALRRTIRYGQNVWLRPFGGVEPIMGTAGISLTAVGARLFNADVDRWEIAGALVGSRLPYAGLIRGPGGVIFFVSELTSKQVYRNETAVAGMTTSATSGRLRLAIPNGSGGFDTYDAGFDKPATPTVTVGAGGTKSMAGQTGVALAPWRIITDTIGPPSPITYNDLQPTTADLVSIVLLTAVSGQDGWIYAGTRPGDTSGELHVIRYVRITPRGTFTATNGSPNITAGVGTFFQQDLRSGDVIPIDGGGPYTVSAVTSQTTLTLTGNYAGATAALKTTTITTAAADWYDAEAAAGAIVDQDIIRLPQAAGVFSFANQYFVWGVTDRVKTPGAVTGPAAVAMLPGNPEHCKASGLMLTASGADMLNVLVGDEQLFVMTTAGLDYAVFTGDPTNPYKIRTVAEPGFKAATNGLVYKNTFYGYNNRPVRIFANGESDVEFAAPVWSDMKAWQAQRVLQAIDPNNEAVLYCYDNQTATSTVIPYMTALSAWNPPHVYALRFIDSAVVQGELYLTTIDIASGNYLVIQWEAGSGGSCYFATQFYDFGELDVVDVIKQIQVAGKLASVTLFVATPGTATPDISNPANGTTFTLSGVDEIDPVILTNLDATAFALGFTMQASQAHVFQKAYVAASPRGCRR